MKRILSLALITAVIAALFPASLVNAYDMGKVGEYQTISAGDTHTAAIKTDGSLWSWGNNIYGQLGNGTTENKLTPVKIMDNVAAVSAGQWYTTALKMDGSLWTWGSNRYRQLGEGLGGDYWCYESTPIKIMDNVAAISAGNMHTAAIKTDGSLWIWGESRCGQFGNGSLSYSYTPIKIMENVAVVSAGTWHTAVIKTDGSLWIWGNNEYRQLGDGTTDNKYTPVKIMDNVAAVSAGSTHTAAIKMDGSLWTWGENRYGQLGDGTGGNYEDYKSTPVKILDNIAQISMGYRYTVAIKTDGTLWSWGLNDVGQLGDGTGGNYEDYKSTPVKIMDNVRLPGGGSTPSPTPMPDTGEIHRITGYDPQNGTLQFDYSAWDYNITDKSIDYNSLVGKFVLAKTYMFDIVSIRRIDDGFGTATNIKDTSIDIDGKTYKLGGYADTIFIDENEKVHYFYDGDTIFGVFDLINLKGKIEDWNESNQTVTINGIVYTISRFSNMSQSVINNIKNAIGTEVSYSADGVNDLYSLDLPETLLLGITSLSPEKNSIVDLWDNNAIECEIEFSKDIKELGTGKIYLHDYNTDKTVCELLPNDKFSTVEDNAKKLRIDISRYNVDQPIILNDNKYYITIDSDAIIFADNTKFNGINNKNIWSFTTEYGLTPYYDTVSFTNMPGAFLHDYEYNGEYDANLKTKVNLCYIASGDLENKIKSILGDEVYESFTKKTNKFTGLCFGISMVTALNKMDLLNITDFDKNASNLYNMKKPIESTQAYGVRDLINYYHLLQYTDEFYVNSFDVTKADIFKNADEFKATLQMIVENGLNANETNKVLVLTYGWRENIVSSKLHCVVICSARKNTDGSYELLIKDPNYLDMKTMQVSSDFSSLTYSEGNRTVDVSLLKVIDVTSLQKDWLIGATGKSAGVDAAAADMPTDHDTLRVVAYGDFSITNDRGETLNYNGGYITGTMEILDEDFVDSGDDNYVEFVYKVNKSDSYTFSSKDTRSGCTVDGGGSYISITADNADSIVMDKNAGISVSGNNLDYTAFATTLTGGNMFSVSGGNTNSLNIALSADGSAEIQADTLKDVEFESLFEDKSFVFDSDSGTADVVETEAGGLAIPDAEIHDGTTFSNIIKENNGGAEVTFANNTAQKQTGTGIVAKYNNDGALIDIETIDLNLSGNESKTVVYGEGDIKYKAFVWDGFDNMKPLSASAEISL